MLPFTCRAFHHREEAGGGGGGVCVLSDGDGGGGESGVVSSTAVSLYQVLKSIMLKRFKYFSFLFFRTSAS